MELWEVDHPYYMKKGNYYKSGEHTNYESLEDFLSEWVDADRDMNRVHRWDWLEPEHMYDGPEDRRGLLQIFFVMQRKACLLSCDINVRRSDKEKVLDYLKPFAELEAKIWAPFDLS